MREVGGSKADADRDADRRRWAQVRGVATGVVTHLRRERYGRHAEKSRAGCTKGGGVKGEVGGKAQEAVTKMSSVEGEIAEFRVQAQRDAAAEGERLRGATILDVEKIRTAAKAEIEAAERAARVELKELAAKLAVDGAESLVAKQMTPALQEATISSFLQSLQGGR